MLKKLTRADWNFSSTAESALAVLLAATVLVATLL
jgi:hypothetical protein